MSDPDGPIDVHIERLLTLLYRNETPVYSEIDDDDEKAYDEAVRSIMHFGFRIGSFAVPDRKRAFSISWNLIKALPGYLDALSETETPATVLARFGRLYKVRKETDEEKYEWVSPSGRFFIELRQRLNKTKWWSAFFRTTEKPPPLGASFQKLLFDGDFEKIPCDIANARLTDKQRRNMKLCAAGCDILLLEALKFPATLQARILGLNPNSFNEEGGCGNKFAKACSAKEKRVEEKLQMARNSLKRQ